MKKLLFYYALSAFFGSAFHHSYSNTATSGSGFTENKGQVADQFHQLRPDVLYSGQQGPMAFHIRNNGVSYQLNRVDKWYETKDKNGEAHKKVAQRTLYRVDVDWLNANPAIVASCEEAYEGFSNYYLEQCPAGVTGVRSFKSVWLSNVYSGINLHYYEKEGGIKYDYVVAPGADYKQIRFRVSGANIFLQEDGSLLLKTPLGDISEDKPVAFQNGRALKAAWRLENETLCFDVDSYDPSLALVIDPIIRVWGTYYGGAGTDLGLAGDSDAAGNFYMAGTTNSSNGTTIATSGAHQTTLGGGPDDAFVAKFNPAGIRQWATYYGGSNSEDGNDCCVDVSGNVYLAGSTQSPAGLASNSAHQTAGGGAEDAFLVKFNSSGLRLWATYYGGSLQDRGFSCSTDPSNNVFLTGTTISSAGIASSGAYQAVYGGGGDAFIAKFNSAGQRQWGTYYGNADDDAMSNCSATDPQGNVYLAGATDSQSSGLASAGAHQTASGGFHDALIVKFNSQGQRLWATFYGGAGGDYAHACSVDASGNVYVSGNCTSSVGIATPGSHQPTQGSPGGYDAYLVKFNSSGLRQWGTYYGGASAEHVRGSMTDAAGNIYLAGYTGVNTGTVISSAGTYQDNYGGGNHDAYLVKFNTAGIRQWGTYYGGAGIDRGYACGLIPGGYIYLAGHTASNTGTIIATVASHQAAHGGGTDDAFLVRFRDCSTINLNVSSNPQVCLGETIILTASTSGTATLNYSWTGPGSFVSNSQSPVIANAQAVHSGTYSVVVSDATGCSETSSIVVNVSACTGIAVNAMEQGMVLYPNPNDGSFTVRLEQGSKVIICNALGQLVYEAVLPGGLQVIDLDQAPPGIYFFKSNQGMVKVIVSE